MARLILLSFLLGSFVSIHVQAQDWTNLSKASLISSFSWLSVFQNGECTFAFDSTKCTVINTRISQLDTTHPLYQKEDFLDDLVLVRTRLSSSDLREFLVVFSEGPSEDPNFYFIDLQAPNQIWGQLDGTALAMPGNGAFYIAGRHNRAFTERRKYLFSPAGFREVRQPFGYVGLSTQTRKTIDIFLEPTQKTPIAQLPENSRIEVLISDEQNAIDGHLLLLVRTQFGLVGWVQVPWTTFVSGSIEGIHFIGD